MARYIVKDSAGITLDGLRYPRGTVLNIHQTRADVAAAVAATKLEAIPRIRFADIALTPPYVQLAAADQISRKQSTGALVTENAIVEPVLPTENKQYD